MNQMIPRDDVETIVANHDKAIEMFAAAFDRIAEADAAIKEASGMWKRAAPDHGAAFFGDAIEVKTFLNAVTLPDRESYLRTARRLISITTWGSLVRRTELEILMDRQAKEQLHEQLRYVPERTDRSGQLINQDEIDKGFPPLTVENVYATLEGFMGQSYTIFRRGLANAFAQLDRRFRSHDGFKFKDRVIFNNAFDEWGHWRYQSRVRDVLIDVERALQILDGQAPKAAYGGILPIIEAERKGGFRAHQSEHEGEFFKVRIYKNGNAHIWFTRKDLLEKANKILAEWYGEVIGDGQTKEADPLESRALTPAKHFGFYPTPDTLAETLIGDAYLHRRGDSPALKVLEPSAGTGQLAALASNNGHHVDCVEIQPTYANALENSSRYRRVIQGDFLQIKPEPVYDRVIMNPPFDRERDIDHVSHALKFLKDDGCLVAIMSAGTEFRQTRKSKAFRALIERMHGVWKDLPIGSFANQGTNVNTIMLRVWKDGRTQSERW